MSVQNGAKGLQEKKIETLFNKHYDSLVNQVFYLVSDFEQAQEIVQDVFMRVYRNLESIQSDEQAANYLYIACRNAVKNEYRRRGRFKSGYGKTVYVEMEKYEAFFETEQSGEDEFFRNEKSQLVTDALEKLKPADREIIVLKEFSGKRYEEIAAILDTTTTVIRGRLHKARKRLKKILEDSPSVIINAG